MSRLDFAPKIEAIEILDIKQGLGKFTPKPAKAASYVALKETLKKAGYKLDSAEITVVGKLLRDAAGWWIEVAESKQRFALEGDNLSQLTAEAATGASFKVTGAWQTSEQGKTKREVIRLSAMQKIAFELNRGTSNLSGLQRTASLKTYPSRLPFAPIKALAAAQTKSFTVAPPINLHTINLPEQNLLLSSHPALQRENLSAIGSAESFPLQVFAASENRLAEAALSPSEANAAAGIFIAPIRTTSPGLTVYHGGGFTPRYFYTKQHLGNLEVMRHSVNLSLSYTPTSTLQLEAQLPYTRTSFKNGLQAGSGQGFGNLTLWGKYRFYRTLETWGDKQAALRFGVELPTGKKDAPVEAKLNAPAFVRQQLTPINNGWAAHFDTSYSQAKHRWIYGANIEATLRAERGGYRLGHEIRVNTDLEYILLPLKYRSPTKELFLIFETTYFHRGQGRIGGANVVGSKSDEFYIAPGLQYIASQRFVLEASYQLPVMRNTGALVLRTDNNFLFGVRYLY